MSDKRKVSEGINQENNMMTIEVVDLRLTNTGGTFKAFAAVRFGDELIIHGFPISDGVDGPIVGVPKKAGKDGRWTEIVMLSASLKHRLDIYVREAYSKELAYEKENAQ